MTYCSTRALRNEDKVMVMFIRVLDDWRVGGKSLTGSTRRPFKTRSRTEEPRRSGINEAMTPSRTASLCYTYLDAYWT